MVIIKYRFPSILATLLFTGLLVAQDNSPYEREYPLIGYGSVPLEDSISKLQARIFADAVKLQFHEERGYLDSILEILNISDTSQILIFSRTSLQQPLISPQTPRAVYFNDEIYVGWVQGSGMLEIASMDPNLGPVFFTLRQTEAQQPVFNREYRLCLRCHDSLSLTGGGTPRFIMSSNYTGISGQLVSHEGSIMTTSRTPIKNRWGGWFVTGLHGEQRHLGNVFIQSSDDLSDENLVKSGNRQTLSDLINLDNYLTPYSDIVALLVVEHQIEVQNMIARVNFLSRVILAEKNKDIIEVKKELLALSDDLLRSLLMVNQPELIDTIEGSSGFAKTFVSLGLKDSEGRSLRDLDLETRLFKYPLSYLIYSDAYKALPEQVKEIIGRKIRDVLSADYEVSNFEHISKADKVAILEILADTNFYK